MCICLNQKRLILFFSTPFIPFVCAPLLLLSVVTESFFFFFLPLWLSQRGAAETLLSAETCDWEDVSRPLLPPRGASDGGLPSLSIRQRNQSPITETVDHWFGKMAQAAALDRNNPLMSCCCCFFHRKAKQCNTWSKKSVLFFFFFLQHFWSANLFVPRRDSCNFFLTRPSKPPEWDRAVWRLQRDKVSKLPAGEFF